MTLRAIIIGVLLGLFISACGFFNDWVIHQTPMIGNFFPVSVFGLVVILALGLNPLAGYLSGAWRRRAGVLGALTLAGVLVHAILVTQCPVLSPAVQWLLANPFRFGAIWGLPLTLSFLLLWSLQVFAVGGLVVLALVTLNTMVAPRGVPAGLRLAILPVVALLGAALLLWPGVEAAGQRWLAAGIWVGLALAAVAGAAWLPMGRAREQAPLRGPEIAVLTALGLAVCGWPGSGYFRYFASTLAWPSNHYKNKTAWQGAHAMAYVPGGSWLLGEGHVRDWPGLCAELTAAAASDQPSPARRLWELAGKDAREALRAPGPVTPERRKPILKALNGALASAQLHTPADFAQVRLEGPLAEARQRLTQAGPAPGADAVQEFNRRLLVAAMPGHFEPRPEGPGVLLLGGRSDRQVVEQMIQGVPQPKDPWLGWRVPWVWPADVPWQAWWPSIRLWGGLALLLGVAGLCLVLVVHPQWSKRELLAYPIPRFISEVTARQGNAWLPEVTRSKLFWGAMAAVLLIHLVKGIKAWNPASFLDIPLLFSFGALREIFPNAGKAPGNNGAFDVMVFPAVVGFAFFLTTDVSFSLGISMILWVMLAGLLIANGVPVQGGWAESNMQNLILFGACVGIGLTVLYVGRRHYWDVLKGTVGLPRKPETPGYSVWACRLMIVCLFGSLALLQSVGLDWAVGVPLLAVFLLIFLVVARINAETGLFFIQTGWMPMAMITAVLGAEAVGPTAYIIMAVASFIMVTDVRELMVPYLANAVQMADRAGQVRPPRMAPLLGAMLIGGFIVALVATLCLQYRNGLAVDDKWARDNVAAYPMDKLSSMVSTLSATDTLESAMQVSGPQRWSGVAGRLMDPSKWREVYVWIALGAGLAVATAVARLRLPWWPLHPVLFVFWGTFPATRFGWSFFIGWAFKAAVTRVGGARGYHNLRPLMVGLIAGDVLAALGWMAAGAVYYFSYGVKPPLYGVYPG